MVPTAVPNAVGRGGPPFGRCPNFALLEAEDRPLRSLRLTNTSLIPTKFHFRTL